MKPQKQKQIDTDSIHAMHVPAKRTVRHDGPLLKREWSFWSLFSFSVMTLTTWEGAATLIGQAFLNGGPAALLYGCITLGMGVSCIYASLAELASMRPMIGAQYVWTAQFSPRKYQAFASYVQGWITTLAWQCLVPTIAYLMATDIRGIIILLSPTYVPQNWHTCLIMIGLVSFSCVAAIFWKRSLPFIAVVTAVLHFLLFFGILATLLARGNPATNSFVWQNNQAFGGWENHGVTFCVGFLTIAFTLSGAEGCVHMAEESYQPEITVPRAIVGSLFLSILTAFAILVALLYNITDLFAVVNTPTGVPLLEIFRQATSSMVAAAVMLSFVLSTGAVASIIALIGTSRLTWAFARDGGIAAPYLDQISPTFRVPLYAVMANTAVTVLLSLVVLGSPVVFSALISFCPLSLYTSYFITISMFLHHRIMNKNIAYGPWRLGRLGIPINVGALCFCLFLMIFLPFPLDVPVTWSNMNYSGPILLLILLGSTTSWFMGARHRFKGPIVGVTMDLGEGLQGYTVFSREQWLSDDTSS